VKCTITFSRVRATFQSRLVSSVNLKFSKGGLSNEADVGTLTSLDLIKEGVLTEPSVTNQLKRINIDDIYDFSFTCANSVTSSGRVEITLPAEISCKATTFVECKVVGSNVALTPVCVCDATL
jgi:hypothetical protein